MKTQQVAAECERRASKTRAVMALVSDGRQHCMRALRAVGGDRFGARVHEVNKLLAKTGAGRQVRAFPISAGHYHYALVGVRDARGRPQGLQLGLFNECDEAIANDATP